MYEDEMEQKEAERLLEEARRQTAETLQKKLQIENDDLKAMLAAANEEAEKLLQQNLLEPKLEQQEDEKQVKPERKPSEEEDSEEDLSTCFMFSTFKFLFLFLKCFFKIQLYIPFLLCRQCCRNRNLQRSLLLPHVQVWGPLSFSSLFLL